MERKAATFEHCTFQSCSIVSTCYNGCDYVIVLGGHSGGGDLTSIEILSKNKWYNCRTESPEDCLPILSATVSNTTLYVMSGNGFIGYSISLRDLLNFVDCQPINSKNTSLSLPWTQLPHLPLRYATPTSICGEFLKVGGQDDRDEGSSAIYQLWNNQFVEVGHLSVARRECLVVTPSSDKIVVVGGCCLSKRGDTSFMLVSSSYTVEVISVVQK